MRWLQLSLSVVFVLVAVPTMAQSPLTNEIRVGSGIATATELRPTSEMWFYQEQLRQYMDPKMSLRRIAEEKANQRRARLTAQRWYGFSATRPTVETADPVHGDWGAHWTSGNHYHPSRWSSFGPSVVVVRSRGRQKGY